MLNVSRGVRPVTNAKASLFQAGPASEKKKMYLAIVSSLTQAVMGAYIPTWSRYPSHAQVVITPQGYLADTPEVEAAKAAHFVEVARRGGAVPPGYGYYPVVNSEGFLEDTPEVAAAKAAHFAEHARARALAAGGIPVAYSVYHYPYSLPGAPVLLPNGYLADTPEVTAAKIAHFAEHARALIRNG